MLCTKGHAIDFSLEEINPIKGYTPSLKNKWICDIFLCKKSSILFPQLLIDSTHFFFLHSIAVGGKH